MLVKATDKYEKLKIPDKELRRIPKAGEQWEISEERYQVLTKTNKYNEIFVEKVIKPEQREVTVEVNKESVEEIEVKKPAAKKKTTRKKKE